MIYRSLWVLLFIYSYAASAAEPIDNLDDADRTTPIAVQLGDTAITNVTVVPLSSDAVLPEYSVVIRGDRIVAVAHRANLVLPAGDSDRWHRQSG